MKLTELKKIIKKHAQNKDRTFYFAYLTEHKTGKEILVNNMGIMDKVTDNQLIKLYEQGFLIKDFNDFMVKTI
jgi:hypothetical protein